MNRLPCPRCDSGDTDAECECANPRWVTGECMVRVHPRFRPAPPPRPCGKPAVEEARRLGGSDWIPVCPEHAAELRRRGRPVRPLGGGA